MGIMALGYGSEFHLLRWLGRHRDSFSQKVKEATRLKDDIHWLDFNFAEKPGQLDEELKGVEFASPNVQKAWRDFWPSTGNQQNWDCVGQTSAGKILLVEAKAHLGELKSPTHAKNDGKEKIKAAFAAVKQSIGVVPTANWMGDYYQFANRIAALWFLKEHGTDAALINIYFLNDLGNTRRKCPKDTDSWRAIIADEYEHLGITNNAFVNENVFPCFIEAYR